MIYIIVILVAGFSFLRLNAQGTSQLNMNELINPPGFSDGSGRHNACDYPDTKKEFVRTDCGRIWVETEGKGKPLFIIGGGPLFDHRYLHPFLASLSNKYKLFYIDLPGRFMSDYCSDSVCGIVRDAEVIDKVRDHYHLDKINVLGHSFGGYIAILYTKLYPSHVEKMVIVSTPLGISYEEADALRLRQREKYKDVKTPEDRLKMYSELNFKSKLNEDKMKYYNNCMADLESYDKYKVLESKYYRSVSEEWPQNLGPKQLELDTAILDNNIPTLVINGENDPSGFTVRTGLYCKRFKNVRYETFENSSSMVFADEPDKFERMVREFLE